MKKVGIFTANSVDKIHPRIQMQYEYLSGAGYDVTIFRTTEKRDPFFWELINWFSLKYFKFGAIHNFKKNVAGVDVVHVYDLQLLPLAKYANTQGKQTIYETLDDNVFLHFHGVSSILRPLKIFKGLVTKRMKKYEMKSSAFCSEIIVNSPNLLKNFAPGKAEYIPYASPLEPSLSIQYNPELPTAFLYLGKLTSGKGALDYKILIEQFVLPLFFFGKAFDKRSLELQKNSLVHSMGNFDAIKLKESLIDLSKQYNLIGLSVIHPENESYLHQEANKDIDYIALGIPFIGNDRPPTLEKIKRGVGVLINDKNAIASLIKNDHDQYNKCVASCAGIASDYSSEKFKISLLKVYSRITQ